MRAVLRPDTHKDQGWALDQSHLTQVLCNLITNATKYGGGTLTFTVTEQLDEVHLSVSDNGPGVDLDFVPHLFERFSRSEQARAGTHRGTGLGLFIVRGLLELNHCSIVYSPTPGGGATFTVAIPRCAQEADPGSTRPLGASVQSEQGSGEAEDDSCQRAEAEGA